MWLMCTKKKEKRDTVLSGVIVRNKNTLLKSPPPPPLTYECLFSLGMCVKKKASYHFQVYILSSDYLLPNLFVSLRLSGSF